MLDGDLSAWLRPARLGVLHKALAEAGAVTPHDLLYLSTADLEAAVQTTAAAHPALARQSGQPAALILQLLVRHRRRTSAMPATCSRSQERMPLAGLKRGAGRVGRSGISVEGWRACETDLPVSVPLLVRADLQDAVGRIELLESSCSEYTGSSAASSFASSSVASSFTGGSSVASSAFTGSSSVTAPSSASGWSEDQQGGVENGGEPRRHGGPGGSTAGGVHHHPSRPAEAAGKTAAVAGPLALQSHRAALLGLRETTELALWASGATGRRWLVSPVVRMLVWALAAGKARRPLEESDRWLLAQQLHGQSLFCVVSMRSTLCEAYLHPFGISHNQPVQLKANESWVDGGQPLTLSPRGARSKAVLFEKIPHTRNPHTRHVLKVSGGCR